MRKAAVRECIATEITFPKDKDKFVWSVFKVASRITRFFKKS
jgi:hypothetical protein